MTLQSQPTQEAVGTAMKTTLRILDIWGCEPEQVQAILQIPTSAYYEYKKYPERASLTQKQIIRLSCILNIHAALRIIFENPDNVDAAMSMPNNGAFFNGATPLSLVATGDFDNLQEVSKRIEAMRSPW